MNNSQTLRVSLLVLLFMMLTLIGGHIGGHAFDMECFKNWSISIYRNGLHNAYTQWNNYMPFYQYIMFIYGKLAGSDPTVGERILYIKSFTILFDFLGLWYVYKWIGKTTDFFLLVLLSVVNIAAVYNTLIWGQVDGIYATFAFASLYYAYHKKPVLSMLWFVLAINMKLQAIIFLPIVLLLQLNAVLDTRKWIAVLYALVTAATAQLLLLAPFLSVKDGFSLFWKEVMSATTTYPRVAMCAQNIWTLLLKANPSYVSDNEVFVAGLSYRQAGFILFFVTSFAALFPLIRQVVEKILHRQTRADITSRQVWLMSALVSLLFYFCNTQMHERYCHPTLIFLTAFAFFTKDFIPYIIYSLAYFLTLEKVLCWLVLTSYRTFIFDGHFIAALYTLVIIYLFVRLYSKERSTAVAAQ